MRQFSLLYNEINVKTFVEKRNLRLTTDELNRFNCFGLIDRRSVNVADADSVAHNVYRPGSAAIEDVIATFGKEVVADPEPSGTPLPSIDRRKLGAIVFADAEAMKKLERIVWPHVRADIIARIQDIRNEFCTKGQSEPKETLPIVVLEAAVLLDAGWDDLVDGLWVVTVSQETAVHRLMENRGLTREDAEKRISAQANRRGIGQDSLASDISAGIVSGTITNDGDISALQSELLRSLNDPSAWYPAERKIARSVAAV
jgi:dephospho-CoA kinase